MPHTINYEVAAQVVDGPSARLARTLTVDAYDKIDVTIPAAAGAAAGTATVQVQPGGAGTVKFLLVTANAYDALLTYTVDGRAGVFKLDAPQLLIGDGAVGMLGNTQKAFAFSNNIAPAAAVAVSIIVGRTAV